jgi:hypothetical protein
MELLGFNEELDGVRLNVHEGDERELHVDKVILGVLLLQSINQNRSDYSGSSSPAIN